MGLSDADFGGTYKMSLLDKLVNKAMEILVDTRIIAMCCLIAGFLYFILCTNFSQIRIALLDGNLHLAPYVDSQFFLVGLPLVAIGMARFLVRTGMAYELRNLKKAHKRKDITNQEFQRLRAQIIGNLDNKTVRGIIEPFLLWAGRVRPDPVNDDVVRVLVSLLKDYSK